MHLVDTARKTCSHLKLPIFSLCPSIVQKPYSSMICSFFSFSAFFSSLLRAFRSSLSFLKCSLIAVKSHFCRSLKHRLPLHVLLSLILKIGKTSRQLDEKLSKRKVTMFWLQEAKKKLGTLWREGKNPPYQLLLLVVHDLPPIFEEIFVEHLFGGVVMLDHFTIKGGHLFRLFA